MNRGLALVVVGFVVLVPSSVIANWAFYATRDGPLFVGATVAGLVGAGIAAVGFRRWGRTAS